MSYSSKIETFHSNGKLLLTGEYLVLKGAKALALPLNIGQNMEVCQNNTLTIEWITFEKETPVFTAVFSLPSMDIEETSNQDKAKYIQQLLIAAKSLNNNFISSSNGYSVKAIIEFNMNWGFGTSSTLINNIAQWSKVDAFKLNNLISKGSGYDIACTQENQPIIYQLMNNQPLVEQLKFSAPFWDKLNVVYLNKKMATESNISKFLTKKEAWKIPTEKTNKLTDKISSCGSLEEFMQYMVEHEKIISEIIKELPVKQKLFSDFDGEIKSLGAWGGDFILVASTKSFVEQKNYFKKKGFNTFLSLNSLTINNNG